MHKVQHSWQTHLNICAVDFQPAPQRGVYWDPESFNQAVSRVLLHPQWHPSVCPEMGWILKISFSRACCCIQCVGSWKVTKAAEVIRVCVCVCPQEAATECRDLYRFSVFSLQRSTPAWRCGQITTSSCVNRSCDWQPPNPNRSMTTVPNGLRRLGLLPFHWTEVQDVEMSPRSWFLQIFPGSFTHKQNVFLSGTRKQNKFTSGSVQGTKPDQKQWTRPSWVHFQWTKSTL